VAVSGVIYQSVGRSALPVAVPKQRAQECNKATDETVRERLFDSLGISVPGGGVGQSTVCGQEAIPSVL
jgi:hypothetical protein